MKQNRKILLVVILILLSFLFDCSTEILAEDSTGKITLNGHTYQLIDKRCSWSVAKSDCEILGGHLVTINSQEEQDLVNDLIYSYYNGKVNGFYATAGACWLGLSYESDSFKWITGETLDYSNWNTGEPNGDGREPYGIINRDGRWNDGLSGSFLYICEWEPEEIQLDKSVDEYILDEVTKYTTSPALFSQYDSIINSGLSREEKLRRLNLLFSYYGIVDINEGITYVSEATSYQRDFLYLVTNENYCAYDYYEWIKSPDGFYARSALNTAGLIYNFELWDYLELPTYATGSLPGVEKCRHVLLEIMQIDHTNIADSAVENADVILEICKNILILNDIHDEILLTNLENAVSIEEQQAAAFAIAQKIVNEGSVEGENVVYFAADGLGKAMDYSTSILEFVGASTETIVDFIYLERDIQEYEKYTRFLKTIVNSEDVSLEMRLAAKQILDEIENGYSNLLRDTMTEYFDIFYKATDKIIYGQEGGVLQFTLKQLDIDLPEGKIPLGDALDTIKLAAYISNFIVDTGEVVRNVCYTQAYAELGALYSIKLLEDRAAFIEDSSYENAWTFFEDYTMLWHLRYLGEMQYMEMQSVDMGDTILFDAIYQMKMHGYYFKEAVTKQILNNLDHCRFTIAAGYEIPASVQYIKKAVVHCPVDVYVYNEEGTCIAVLQDGIESDFTNEYGRFSVIYDSYTGEYLKVICQSTEGELTIELYAQDMGMVDFEMCDGNNISYFSNVVVNSGDVIYIQPTEYTINSSAGVETRQYIIRELNEYIALESVQMNDDEILMECGERKLLEVNLLPLNASNQTLEWYALDPEIVNVSNGVVTAMAIGETTIYIKATDNESIFTSISVKVTNTSSDIEGPTTGNTDAESTGTGEGDNTENRDAESTGIGESNIGNRDTESTDTGESNTGDLDTGLTGTQNSNVEENSDTENSLEEYIGQNINEANNGGSGTQELIDNSTDDNNISTDDIVLISDNEVTDSEDLGRNTSELDNGDFLDDESKKAIVIITIVLVVILGVSVSIWIKIRRED